MSEQEETRNGPSQALDGAQQEHRCKKHVALEDDDALDDHDVRRAIADWLSEALAPTSPPGG